MLKGRERERSFCFLKLAAFGLVLRGLSVDCGDIVIVLESIKQNPTGVIGK